MERSVSLQTARVCARRTVTAHDIRTAETCLWRSLPWIGERLAPRCACEHSTRAAHVRCASCWCLRVNLVSPAFFWSSVVRVALSHGSSLSAVATCSSYPLISLRAVVFMYTYIHTCTYIHMCSSMCICMCICTCMDPSTCPPTYIYNGSNLLQSPKRTVAASRQDICWCCIYNVGSASAQPPAEPQQCLTSPCREYRVWQAVRRLVPRLFFESPGCPALSPRPPFPPAVSPAHFLLLKPLVGVVVLSHNFNAVTFVALWERCVEGERLN